MTMRRKLPAVLTIAGSDSGGGAGIQADLRTFCAFQVYGCSAITAVTSQNPNEVRRVDILPVETVKSQLETILSAIPVQFAKTGMLANREIIECVAAFAEKHHLRLVIDPVMVSTSGARLLEESAISAMKEQLFPLAEWITPNIPEAELLSGRKINFLSDLSDAALALSELFGCSVILKSGHMVNTEDAADIICHNGQLYLLSSPRLAVSGNTSHGTGCTLSSALTANLALGKSWDQAVMEAKAFVYGSLAENVCLSENLYQMFLPEKSYLNKISLSKDYSGMEAL